MGAITVDTRDRKPIWEQLVSNIKSLVLRGILKPDEQLPSVRALAGELAINPNTIQKAYAELERQGIICSLPGRGSFITGSIDELTRIRRQRIFEELEACLKKAQEAGLTREEIYEAAEKIYGGQK